MVQIHSPRFDYLLRLLRLLRLGSRAPVAQLDRASASGAEGPAFESRLAHKVTTQASSW